MRIILVAYSFYETDNRVRRYAEALANRGDHVDVIAIAREGSKKYEKISGVNVYRIQHRKVNEKSRRDYFFRIFLFFIKSFFSISWRHLKTPYDLVHVHSVPDFEVFAALLPKITGSRILLDIHDLVPEFYSSKFKVKINNPIVVMLKLIERVCCSFANHVIISNELWRSVLISRSVKSEKCTTVINYPDTNIFSYRGIKKTDSSFLIIYPGTLNYHQGVDILVRAMVYVKDITPVIKLNIYGSGPQISELIDIIENNGLQSNVFMHNMIPLEEIAKIMAQADLGVVPKRSEGFGNEAFSTKTLEYMALGVPVLASGTKIDHYYFNDSVVEFFNPGDVKQLSQKILYLYSDQNRRDLLVKNALEYVRENCWSKKQIDYFNIVDEKK